MEVAGQLLAWQSMQGAHSHIGYCVHTCGTQWQPFSSEKWGGNLRLSFKTLYFGVTPAHFCAWQINSPSTRVGDTLHQGVKMVQWHHFSPLAQLPKPSSFCSSSKRSLSTGAKPGQWQKKSFMRKDSTMRQIDESVSLNRKKPHRRDNRNVGINRLPHKLHIHIAHILHIYIAHMHCTHITYILHTRCTHVLYIHYTCIAHTLPIHIVHIYCTHITYTHIVHKHWPRQF